MMEDFEITEWQEGSKRTARKDSVQWNEVVETEEDEKKEYPAYNSYNYSHGHRRKKSYYNFADSYWEDEIWNDNNKGGDDPMDVFYGFIILMIVFIVAIVALASGG